VNVGSIDLRVGGNHHSVFVTDDGTEMSFRGTYLEVEAPTRPVETWRYDGWPDAEAVFDQSTNSVPYSGEKVSETEPLPAVP
jgi:uncharacterized protein YndB with AHSA1/START domain